MREVAWGCQQLPHFAQVSIWILIFSADLGEDSPAWDLCRWFPWSEGNRRRSPRTRCRSGWCCHQTSLKYLTHVTFCWQVSYHLGHGSRQLCTSWLVIVRGVACLTSVPQNGPELAAQGGLHQHVDILPVLERLVQPGTEQIETSEFQQCNQQCSDSCALG